MMGVHDCGCVTHWDDELDHPVYDKACFGHRPFARNWMVSQTPTKRLRVPEHSK